MLLPLLAALLLAAPPNPCGVVVAGEPAFTPFFERALADGIASGRYDAGLAQSTAQARARLVQWETRCDATAQRVAVQDLRRLVQRFRTPEREYLQALLATALSRGPEVRAPHSRGGIFVTARRSSNAEREARRLFDVVLPRWSTPELLYEYAALALATRDPATLDSADAALREHAPPSTPDVLRALHALVVLAAHDTVRAASLARAVPASSPRAMRLAAIVRLIADADADADAAQAARTYFDALAAAGPDDSVLFYEDIWPLLSEENEQDWDALPPGARTQWLREEWEWRASRSSRTPAERLRIHFQRAQHAIDWYPRLSFRGGPDPAALLIAYPPGTPFDDRGLLYVRHGEPAAREVSLNAEVWHYPHLDARRRDGLFVLRKPGTRVDWVAVNNACAVRSVTPASMEQCIRARRATETAVHTENAMPPFRRLLPGSLVTYAFRAADGSTELLAYTALRAGSITPHELADGVGYQLSATVAVEHPRERQVERRDTTLTLRLPARPDAEQALRIGMSVAARPDSLALVRVTILNADQAGEGQVLLSRRPVPSFATAQLALSDIVIAEPRDGGTLRRGAHTLAPLPGHDIVAGATFRVFHETYGVTVETPARVRITIAPVVDDNLWGRLRGLLSQRQALDLQFDDVLEPEAGGVSYLTRDVTADLEPGRYSLRVEVTTAAGSAVRTTHITLLER